MTNRAVCVTGWARPCTRENRIFYVFSVNRAVSGRSRGTNTIACSTPIQLDLVSIALLTSERVSVFAANSVGQFHEHTQIRAVWASDG